MTDWGTQFIGMCSKKCKVAWGKYANKHATVAQVKSYASQRDVKPVLELTNQEQLEGKT